MPEVPVNDNSNSYELCLDAELREMLQAALAWHQQHPEEIPEVQFPPAGTHSPCQTRLYDVHATAMELPTECDNKVEMPSLGVHVTVSAPDADNEGVEPVATLGGEPLCLIDRSRDDALRKLDIVVPASADGQSVTIEVDTDYGTLITDVALPPVVPPTQPTPEPTGHPTPTEDP